MKLECHGASREVGRSAFLLHTDKKLLLDYGIKVFGRGGEPEYPDDISYFDAMLLSHAHLDHSGFIPFLYKHSSNRWYSTPPTREISEILWMDSMKIMGDRLPYTLSNFNKSLKFWNSTSYNKKFSIGNTEITYLDAGHIAGSAMILLEYEGKKVLYTGDFKIEETRMHSGANFSEKVDALIIDSTYALREHPDRKELELKLIDEIEETLSNGGNILLPAFAVGRTQELISIVRSHLSDVPVFVDGMGKEITRIYSRYGNYISDVEKFREFVESVKFVENIDDKKAALKNPSVIISTAGMLEGGPALNYLIRLNKESKIIFTGYNVEGTNGWMLLNKGSIVYNEYELDVELPVEYFDFSAHAGRSDILKLIGDTDPEIVISIHGDSTEKFAEELRDKGLNAVAPKKGDVINL